MSKRNQTILGIALCLFTAGSIASGLSHAQPAEGEGPHHQEGKGWHKDMAERHQKHFAEVIEKLGLSEEQKTKLEAHKKQHMEQAKELRTQMEAKRTQLRDALGAPQLDKQKVTAIHAELVTLITRRENDRLATILEIREILTPEQFVKFQSMEPKRKGPPSAKDTK